jgi:mRNA interferase HigB
MHIIARTRLQEFWVNHADAETSLRLWYERTKQAQWENFIQVREVFSSADEVGKLTVFNIGGNKYRLIALVKYKYKKVYIRNILTHAEYDKGDWKNDPWFEES